MSDSLKPIIGITVGDTNGIGPEIALKVLSDEALYKHCIPVIYASVAFTENYKKIHSIDTPALHTIEKTTEVQVSKLNVADPWKEQVELQMGQPTVISGKLAFLALQKAVFHLKNNYIHALVTGPIDKKNIQQANHTFIGHTEYLQQQFKQSSVLMFMVSESLKIAVATMHIPVSQVSSALTQELLESKIRLMSSSLQNDFGIQKPRIAVLGLNPHAGEQGTIGSEDQEVILPVIKKLQQENQIVSGPFPSDGFFASGAYAKADGVLAMYHDQGLIPFKMLAFEQGVNFTAGLPAIRTSPDHGTAFDIAGTNKADASSMRHALYTALDIIKARKENATKS